MIKIIRSLRIFCICAFVVFFSCLENYETTKNIPGDWMIENISYNEINYKDSLRYNIFFFKLKNSKNIVVIPNTSYCERTISKWSQLDDNYILINSSNKVFNGKFKVKYFDDKERNLIGAIFKSENTYIEAYKLGNDYSDEYDVIGSGSK